MTRPQRSIELGRHQQELRMHLDRLRVLAHAVPGVLPPDRLRRLLAHDAGHFATALARYFALEEAGGLADAVATPSVTQQRRISALAEQHRALAFHAAEFARHAAKQDAAAATSAVDALAREFEAHEHDEVHLVQGALADDLSAAD